MATEGLLLENCCGFKDSLKNSELWCLIKR